MAQSKKESEGKLMFELISPYFLEGIAQVMTASAESGKYEHRNWELGGVGWGKYFAALMRHCWAWWRGEEYDQEDDIHHLHHAACCLMFLCHYVSRASSYGKDDDRPQLPLTVAVKQGILSSEDEAAGLAQRDLAKMEEEMDRQPRERRP